MLLLLLLLLLLLHSSRKASSKLPIAWKTSTAISSSGLLLLLDCSSPD